MDNITADTITDKLTRIARIDRTAKERQKRYLNSKKENGYRQVSLLLSADTYNLLCKAKDKLGVSINTAIEQALISVYSEYEHPAEIDVELTPEVDVEQPEEAEAVDLQIDIDVEIDLELTTRPDKFTEMVDVLAFKKRLYKQISALRQAGKTYIEIADLLNGAGVKSLKNKLFNSKSLEKIYNSYQKLKKK